MNYKIKHTCILEKRGDLVFYRIPLFEKAGNVKAFFTTRLSGFSTSEKLSSLNLGFSKGEDPENVRQNYKKLLQQFNLDPQNIILTKQEHTDCILSHAEKYRGMGWSFPVSIIADSEITDEQNCILVKFTADCVPVLLFDPVKGVIASVHDGWRGTIKTLAEKTVNQMVDNYHCNPENILAAIGPSIGPCCFEIGKEVAEEFLNAFETSFTFPTGSEKYHTDLWSCNIQQLLNAGILIDHIAVAHTCTYCNKSLFYSYRREGVGTGSLAAMISL